VNCPNCNGSARSQISASHYQCITVHTQLVPGRALGDPPMVEEEYTCDTMYSDGAPASRESPLCKCGTYAVGVCCDCRKDVCGMHSFISSHERVCEPCRSARIPVENAKAVQEREASELAEAIAYAARPNQTHKDRVQQLRLSGTDQNTQPIEISGAEIARCLIEADVETREWWLPKEGMFRKQKRIIGWLISSERLSLDGRGGSSERILDLNGAEWHIYDRILTRTSAPDELHDRFKLVNIYHKTNAFYCRVQESNSAAEQAKQEAEQARMNELDGIRYGGNRQW
jgi:hypothetical protein